MSGLRDMRGYSVLAFCAMKDNLLALKIVYEHAMTYNEFKGQDSLITDWANQQTDRGFTALHFAAYHGNFDLITYLVDVLGADMYAKN